MSIGWLCKRSVDWRRLVKCYLENVLDNDFNWRVFISCRCWIYVWIVCKHRTDQIAWLRHNRRTGYLHDCVIKWNIFRVTGPLCEELTGHRSPVNYPHKGQWRGVSIFSLNCALTNRFSKQSWCWWFETPSRSLWRHCNVGFTWKLIYLLSQKFVFIRHFCVIIR